MSALGCLSSRLLCAGSHSVQLDEALSDKQRMAATPAYVISGVNERWEHSRGALAMLHVSLERVWPPKPSLHLAKAMYAVHDYDRHANLSDERVQRYMSLLAAWRHALGHIAHHPDLLPDEWALAFEDDISLHDNLTLSAARAAVLRGFSLARTEGWLYLGMCLREGHGRCWQETAVEHGGVEYAKCNGVCSHALAFTKRRAATMLADMHASMKGFTETWGSYPGAPVRSICASCSPWVYCLLTYMLELVKLMCVRAEQWATPSTRC